MLHPMIYPTFVFSLLILVGGLVILLLPLSRRLPVYVELLLEERRRARAQPIGGAVFAGLTDALEAVDRRLARMEERQEFTDRLLAEGRGGLPAAQRRLTSLPSPR